MQFKQDIFISYTHRDNVTFSEEASGWVSDFHSVVEKFLNQLMRRKPRIWRDVRTMSGNTQLTEDIRETILNTGVLVTIMSPAYMTSPWCELERDTFLSEAEKAQMTNVNNQFRVFKVLKTPVPLEEQPDKLRDMLGYAFYNLDEESGRAHEFNRVFGKSAEERFLAKAYEIATDIAEMLHSLDDLSGDQAGEPTVDKTVFLSFPSFDLLSYRDVLKRELQSKGCRVVPNTQFPLTADEFIPWCKGFLEESDLAIHLTGANYGLVPEGSTVSITEMQNRLAAEVAQERNGENPLERLLWIPAKLEFREDRAQEFIENVKKDPVLQFGADIIEDTMEGLKTVVTEKLKPPPPAPEEEEEASGLKRVYLICDRSDRKAAKPLRAHLMSQGIEVKIPVFKGEEAAVRTSHENKLVEADAVIIYYGDVPELWVEAQLSEIRKAPGLGRKRPYVTKPLVLLTGEETDEKEDFMTLEAEVMEAYAEEIPVADLESFINAIKQSD
ncbi:MAG: TIR domain-containing protein [Bacteroidota bacterium]